MLLAPAIPELPDASLPDEGWNARLLTRLGEAVDATVLRAMQLVVDAALMPPPDRLPELLASAERLLDPALQRDPTLFFRYDEDPGGLIDVTGDFRRNLPGGVALGRELVYRYTPHGLDDAEGGATAREERIHLEHWTHRWGRAHGTVVTLHGFTMGQPRLDATVLFARQWFQRGLDVALLTLPHHGARKPADARFSGESFAVPHVARLSEAVRQAIREVGLVTRWLRQESSAPVGLLGISLGGYLSALAACLYDDLDFVVPMVPPACIGDLAWRYFERSRHYASAAEPAFSKQELRTLFRIHSPLSHAPRVARERLMIVAGRGDRIVPPEHPHALWCHWKQPRIHWFSGSHLAPFGRQRIVDDITAHLTSLGIL